ncbi:hypothetical protein OUZ56_021643 [Daphnia magna]|uniref:CxC3 like cysteine cluster domain-containing protein n=1 Tax=Daphnia magna TaxID=35525 RepID=A0ABR0AU29_9CRUS|nr:hypothetical protein OUZ56_021643 [Daphnia magna]
MEKASSSSRDSENSSSSDLESSSSNDAENSSDSDSETSSTEQKGKCIDSKRKRGFFSFSKSKANKKKPKTVQKPTAGKCFTYVGKTRQKKKILVLVMPFHIVHHPSNSHHLFHRLTVQHMIHCLMMCHQSSAQKLLVNDLRRQVQNDLDSMQIRRHQTWQERQAIAAWGRHDRRRIFTEYVSRQPLYHSKCDQCHEDLDHCSVRYVCVPCFVFHKSCDISCHGSMSLIPNITESIVVVTEQGRFVLKGATFVCDTCSSKNMYAHTLEEVSKEYGRTGPINIPLFTTAEREWETCRHYIDQEVFKRNKIDCPSCGTKPLVRSSDAIIKLRRLASAGKARKPENERVMDDVESRFENLVIKSDVEVESFRQRIYNKVQTSKKKNMCGGSAFKAAREDSNENKKYDETGLVVSSCKHCIVPYAINMFKGESWTHTAFMHYEAWKSQATFFCYDVVCQYWKWMHQKVGPEFPEYMMLTKEMTEILPIMHQMAHQLPCQVLWNPRWTKGLGLTGGEEHEQVFSKLYLYAYVLKHRADFLTLAILYWNWNKIQNMPFLLRNKLQRARKEIRKGVTKVEELLQSYNLENGDLPLIHKELERKAIEIIDQRRTKTTPVDKLRRMLEGFYVQLKTVRIKISKEAENSKARTKFRRILIETKKKVLQTIDLLKSKDKDLPISYEDFNQGIFPWEAVINENDTNFPTLSYADKYHVVDCWMLLQRSKEEVELTKIEMINYIRFLTDKRSSLKQLTHSEEADETFCKGKAVMAHSEIERLNLQIQLSLKIFNLNCNNDFSNFVRETNSNSGTEFEFETSDEETDNSYTKFEFSDEETETHSSDSDDY